MSDPVSVRQLFSMAASSFMALLNFLFHVARDHETRLQEIELRYGLRSELEGLGSPGEMPSDEEFF